MTKSEHFGAPGRFISKVWQPKFIFATLVLMFGLWMYVHQIKMSGSSAFNEYSFVSSDGIDWIGEGHFLWAAIKAGEFPFALNVLRPPVYVLFSTMDAALGGQGYVFAFVSVCSCFATVYYVIRFINMPQPSLIAYICIFIVLILSPINFFRLYYQADPLATALSLAAAWYVFQSMLGNNYFRNTVLGFILVTMAGLTQTYGVIPAFFVFAVMSFFNIFLPEVRKVYKKRELRNVMEVGVNSLLQGLIRGGGVLCGIICVLIFKKVWVIIIPHEVTPDNFELLKFSFDMISFYGQTWGYYLGPIIFLLIGMSFFPRVWKIWKTDMVVLSMAIITLAFMTLLLAYQWKDARFTYYFWPFLIIIFGRLAQGVKDHNNILSKFVFILAAVSVLAQTYVFYPQSYESPKFSELNPAAKRQRDPFTTRFLDAKPVDRLSLRAICGNKENVCENVKIPKNSTPYRTHTYRIYLKLHGISNPQKTEK